MELLDSVKTAVKALSDKKASDIKILDISGLTSIGEYFIICSCQSTTQVRACVDEVEERLEKVGVRLHHKEGYSGGTWILMDYSGFLVHVMQEETRGFYDIERLWDEAEEIVFDDID